MAKKRKQTRSAVGSLTPAQMEQFEFQMKLQERALQMAEAQMEREQANKERQSQFDAFGKLAEMYAGKAGEAGAQYDRYSGQAEGQRESALAQLAEAYGRGQTGISDAERQLMESLVAGQSYSDVPLVELGQITNPLLAGLAAEGASSAGVEQQSAQDAQMAAQLAAMTRGSMGQLNTGEANYLTALRNAGAFSAAQARQGLSSNQAMIGQGIRSEYDRLAQQIAQQRLGDVSDYESRALEASGQQQGFAPVEGATDFAAQLEAARQEALKSIRSSLPRGMAGSSTPKTDDTPPVDPPIVPTGGKITSGMRPADFVAPSYPDDFKFSAQQLKRKREIEDLIALRARGK